MKHIDIGEVRRVLADASASLAGEQWTGALVGERMIEAFRTLGRLPERDRPRGFAPTAAFLRDAMTRDVFEQDDPDRRRPRRRATPAEVSAMERSFDRAMRYLRDDRRGLQCLLAWSYAKLRNGSIKWLLAKHGMTRAEFDEHRRRAVMTIAAGLMRDRVPVA